MKKFVTFLWRATIPILWLLSVLAIVRGGFNPGFVWPPLPVGQSYPYPWASVIVMSIVTAVECAFFYLILRPDRLVWSLPRAGIAFVVSLPLFILGLRTTPVDIATNFVKSLWKFDSVFDPKLQIADHRMSVKYQMAPPPQSQQRVDARSIYIHQPRGRASRQLDDASERFVDSGRSGAEA